jgi:hypothetical protein
VVEDETETDNADPDVGGPDEKAKVCNYIDRHFDEEDIGTAVPRSCTHDFSPKPPSNFE